jgi:hypothetical protein
LNALAHIRPHALAWQPEPAFKLNVIGVSGEGKSTLRSLFLGPIYRCILANPLEDLDIGEVVSTDEVYERIDEFRKGPLRLTVKPTSYEPQAMFDEFDTLCSAVYEIGAVHFAIEEISLYRGPDAQRLPGNLSRIAAAGRHRAVSHSVYGQRFHQFPLIIRGQSTQIIAFRQSDPDDVDDFDKRIYPDVSPTPINQLPRYHFISWTPEHGASLHAPLFTEDGRLDGRELENNRKEGNNVERNQRYERAGDDA